VPNSFRITFKLSLNEALVTKKTQKIKAEKRRRFQIWPIYLSMKTSVRKICLFLIYLLYSFTANSQNKYLDSSKRQLQEQKEDTNKVKLLTGISFYYLGYYPDTSVIYAQQAIDLAEKLEYDYGILDADRILISSLVTLGNYPLAVDFGFKELTLAKKIGIPRYIVLANVDLAWCYYNLGDYHTSLKYDSEIIKLVKQFHPDSLAFVCGNLSMVFEVMNQPDSAILYAQKCYEGLKAWHYLDYNAEIFNILGNAFASKANYDSALFYYRTGLLVSINTNWPIMTIDIYNGIAKMYKAKGNLDSALWYAQKVLTGRIGKPYPNCLLKASNILVSIYESKNKPDSTLKYLRIATAIKDSLFNSEKTIAIQNLVYKEQEKQKAIESARLQLKNRFKIFLLMVALIILLATAAIFFNNRRLSQLQNIRNNIADDLHDDIGSTLSSISIMNELAKAKSPEALPLLSSIGESTSAIQENMSDIVWAVNPKNDRMGNVLQRMNQFASEMLDAKNMELDFLIDASRFTSKITMGQRKNFYLFFKEVINNAAKYSDAKRVSVRIVQKDHYIEMKISDNGKGFDVTKIISGNGMSTLKKRGAELGADFNITSHINEGTVVQLKFKIT
jgi:two-component system sensor histidine kinase UhpB